MTTGHVGVLRRRDPEGFTSGPNGERPDWFFTGPQPVPGSAGMQPDGTITSLPLPDLSTCTRQEALAYFDNTWLLSEVLFSGLQGEHGARPDPACSAAQAASGQRLWGAARRPAPISAQVWRAGVAVPSLSPRCPLAAP